MISEFKYVSESNEETLTYFNKLFSQHEEKLQEYKAKLFEINIKIDELNRTKSIYSHGKDFRRNVFSPIPEKRSENDKETQIISEIETLTNNQDYYEDKIEEETAYLRNIAKRINRLVKAKKIIQKVYSGDIEINYINKDDNQSSEDYDSENDEDDDDEFIDLEAFLNK
ncbi:MAG: hypothetical protein J6M65_07065 [Eubacterium sp.]|nr:hypothetical protein [Eubacterium sp.]